MADLALRLNHAEVSLKIVHNASDLNQDTMNAPLYVTIGRYMFPSETWSDFVITILTMWMDNLNALLAFPQNPPPMQNRYQLSFLDGPWTVLIETAENNKVHLRLRASQKIPGSHLDNNVEFSEQASEITTMDSLVAEILQVATEVMDICIQKKLSQTNPDVERMAEAMELLVNNSNGRKT